MGLKIKVSPLFILFSFLVVFFGHFSLFFTYITILLIHELTHYLLARKYGYMSQTICIMPYGLVMNDENLYSKKDEIFISLAGPIVNILLALVCVAMWWYIPQSYYFTYDFMFANMILGIYNLIPIYPLDGGRVLLALSSKKHKNFIRKCMKTFSIFFSILFLFIYIYSLFDTPNASYLFMSFFLLSTLFHKEEVVFPKFCNNKFPREVRTFIVSKDTDFYSLLKLIKGDYFYNFIVVDSDGKLVKSISQDELIDKYSRR